ncbi:MAG: TetR/AcrR family transcriptional regulator C-terminal domain-containing protein [Oscillospiraceae bacterium]|nr:TetR/AcrR family transcriptional regulator C-terminal domain-containing protein [Oscillospiraceae bacterium]
MPNFTRDAIIKSFLGLLSEKPVSKITVKDIVEDCGINRNSFYYHFQDLPALIEALLHAEADRIISENASLESFEDCIMAAVSLAQNNKNAVMHLYQADRGLYGQYLNRIAEYAVEKYISTASKGIDIPDDDRNIIVHYYKCLLVGMVLDWMNSGMQYDISSRVSRVCELFDGSMQQAINRASGQKIRQKPSDD